MNKLFVFVVNLDSFYDCKVNFKESNVVDTSIYLFCINFDLKQFVVSLYNNCWQKKFIVQRNELLKKFIWIISVSGITGLQPQAGVLQLY